MIEESSLETLKTYGKAGKPKGANGKPKTENEKSFKTIFDVAPELIGSIKDGLPTDLSTNKDYLKDLGKKSAEKKALQMRNKQSKDD